MDILLAVGVFAAWIVLQKWVLPKLGVPTWLEPNCRVPAKKDDEQSTAEQAKSVSEGEMLP